MATWGYIRVSSRHQNLDRQIDALREEGVADDHIISDKSSGKDFNREGYQRLLTLMEPGDTLIIHSLDRLGRSYEEVPFQWNHIVRDLGVNIRVLDMELLNSRDNMSRTECFLYHILLMVQSFFAAEERYKLNERQREGIAAARARGVVFGRPQAPLPENFGIAYERYRKKEISAQEAARLCGVNRNVFYKRMRRYRARQVA